MMTLGELIKQLVSHLNTEVRIPFENEAPWHELFYQLKRENIQGKPPFFKSLRFDWDGPYPKCKQVTEYLHALHWNACISVCNPTFDAITLPEDIAAHWKAEAAKLDPEQQDFLSEALKRAKQEFRACPSQSSVCNT
jgi:hypothetical protein